jgi:hypothetical protein
MPVYLIRSGSDGLVKIGFSETVHKRLTKMQVGSPDKLTVLRILDGGKELEAALHARFKSYRVRGEWFTFSEDMLGDLGAAGLRQSTNTRGGPCSLERRAAGAAARAALNADPVWKEARAKKLRDAAARNKFQRVYDVVKRVGGWQKFADLVQHPVVEVMTWKTIPVRYLETVATAANVPVMKLSEIAERDAA